MKIYMSWWTKGHESYPEMSKKKLDEIIFYTDVNVKLLRKNYEEINLITDLSGKEIFKNIKWDNVYTPLESINEKYSIIWCLGKLYAYQFLVQKNEPFLHLDNDFFVLKKLPIDILDSDILVQSRENIRERWYVYNMNLFNNQCIEKYLAKNINTDIAYNCGIIGGNDLNFFDFYSSTSIKMIEDEKNKNMWLNINNAKYYYTLPVLAEQYYLSASSIFLNRKVTCLFEALAPDLIKKNNYWYKPEDPNFFYETACFHPLGDNKIKLINFIKENIFSKVN